MSERMQERVTAFNIPESQMSDADDSPLHYPELEPSLNGRVKTEGELYRDTFTLDPLPMGPQCPRSPYPTINDWRLATGRITQSEYNRRQDEHAGWTPQGGGQRVPAPLAFTYSPLTSDVFFSIDYRPDWLVKNLIVANQPCVVGGPAKSMKTSLLVDLAISLATGTPLLNTFEIKHARRVSLLSGESGEFTLQETGRRVCAAKNIDPVSMGDRLQWLFRLPQLAIAEQLDELKRGLERHRAEVCMVDPLYMSLLAGGDTAMASNVYAMGPLLRGVSEACLSVGCSPVMAHHSPKPKSAQREPLELGDLAYAGISEFARQWLLLNRREDFVSGSGQHLLWLVAGGSVGHGGLWGVDIDEGQLAENFTGRRWNVTVKPGHEVRTEKRESKTEAKASAKQIEQANDDQAMLRALDTLVPAGQDVPYARVRDLSGLTRVRASQAFERLLAAKIVDRTDTTTLVGNNAKRPCVGIVRIPEKGTDATLY